MKVMITIHVLAIKENSKMLLQFFMLNWKTDDLEMFKHIIIRY